MRKSMTQIFRSLTIAAATLLAVHVPCVPVWAQNNLTEPVYRVAAETPATPAAVNPAATTAVTTDSANIARPAAAALDFTRQGDEHPLMPVIRGLKTSQDVIDKSIRDYSCTFVKRERVDGQLGEQQYIFMKLMHQPFSVYMSFLKPFAGREVVYVAGQNNGKLVALDAGVKRYLGKMSLDPNGALAMKGQKRPITDVGIRNLCAKLIKLHEGELQFAECEVTANPDTKINGRKTTMVQIVHPTPRQNFKHHVSRLFFDIELSIPIHYDAYLWPAQPGAQPPLEESYTYQNLKINNNFTARDFDPNNNPEIFKQ
jgi:hypothetical protein